MFLSFGQGALVLWVFRLLWETVRSRSSGPRHFLRPRRHLAMVWPAARPWERPVTENATTLNGNAITLNGNAGVGWGGVGWGGVVYRQMLKSGLSDVK